MLQIDLGNTKGIKRKLDNLGRITLPMEFRKELNVNERDTFEMYLLDNGIFVKKC